MTKTSPAMLFRTQAALRDVPGPEQDATRGGFNPLQCASGSLRIVSELLRNAQPPPTLPPGALLEVCMITIATCRHGHEQEPVTVPQAWMTAES